MAEEWMKPAAAASRLKMPSSTLRVYSIRFASLLSPSASDPPSGSDGKRGSRLYGSTDIAVLSRAKDLLATGLTYDQVLSELRLSLPHGRSAGNGGNGASCPIVLANKPYPTVSVLTAEQVEELAKGLINTAVSHLDSLVKHWEGIATERSQEINLLRSRVAELEEQLRASNNHKPGGISRLFR
jgi:hypothetical protein